MLNDIDFQVWRSELRKFLHQWSGSTLLAPPLTVVTGTLGSTMERAEELLNSSMRSLELYNASHPSVDIKNVLTALAQVQEQHQYIRQHLARRPRSEYDRRTPTPLSRPISRAGNSPLPFLTNKNLSDVSAANAGAAAGGGAGTLLGVDAAAESMPHSASGSVLSTDDGDFDFFDADDMVDGVEYEMSGDDDDDDDDETDEAMVDVDNNDDKENEGVLASQRAIERPSSYVPMTTLTGPRSNVTYRKTLPAPVTGEDVSLFSILKKNVGKDLTAISFPVTFNAPLSILQAVAEEYEYAPAILERAAKSADPIERICLVGAFAVSSYASTAQRSTRKPFNPLLGETFECVRADRKLNFIAEKVVHRPPVTASYAYGAGWRTTAAGTVKNKFWGKSLELIAEGTEVVELDTGDKYNIVKPSSFMRNLLAGTKYLEHVGEMTITNIKTDEHLVIQFKEGSMFGGAANRNHIEGTVYDANQAKVGFIKGRWDESVARITVKGKSEPLWEAEKMPHNASDYYGFTYFAMSLNEITDDIRHVLPPTDSRFRPDQRALEDGDADAAEELKLKLENEQRVRRKVLEETGEKHQPQWFHLGENGVDWEYGGPDGRDYFEERDKIEKMGGEWKIAMSDIFNT